MKSIVQHLRFPFSILLMPVFLFAIYCIPHSILNFQNTWILFFILHILVYPASNAYNSTQDRDEGSVGLIKEPLPIPKQLFLITVLIDFFAILLSLLINTQSAILLTFYIFASRLYSWRRIRLKQYPIVGFLTVFICQGTLVYFMTQFASNVSFTRTFNLTSLRDFYLYLNQNNHILDAGIASLFIGSMYPLSQIYQHEQDSNDGVKTISALLGYRNTFLFSGLQFILASALLSSIFILAQNWQALSIYSLCQAPVVCFFLYWFYAVMKDHKQANFKNTMYMNLISAFCMNVCFIILIRSIF